MKQFSRKTKGKLSFLLLLVDYQLFRLVLFAILAQVIDKLHLEVGRHQLALPDRNLLLKLQSRLQEAVHLLAVVLD